MPFGSFKNVQLPFDKDGNVTAAGPIDGTHARDQLLAIVPDIDDLVVISHGWNNDVIDAQHLYDEFFDNVHGQWQAAGLTDRDFERTAVLAVYWPSKRFDEPNAVTGNAAGIQDAPTEADYQAKIEAQIANLKDERAQFAPPQQKVLDDALAASKALDDPAAQTAFVLAMAKLLPAPHEADPGLDTFNVHAAQEAGADILQGLATELSGLPGAPPDPNAPGGAAALGDVPSMPAELVGSAQGLDPLAKLKQAAWMLLNCTTYFVMKERAGLIGPIVTPLVLEALAKNQVLRVHLVGHSFGGRLVTALADALPAAGPTAATMSLLQAAYSHYGLAPAPSPGAKDRPAGAFRSIIEQNKVRGLIQITHSEHDWAVGAAYPIASAIGRQTASFIVPGTAGLLWGGMGANGAQQTPESYDTDMLDGHVAYAPPPAANGRAKRIRNLNGNAFISEHGDVRGKQVTWAFLQAFKGSRA